MHSIRQQLLLSTTTTSSSRLHSISSIRRIQSINKKSINQQPQPTQEFHYPTKNDTKDKPDHLIQNPFLNDPTYIKRYRDPSRHDSYQLQDHHQPYNFRIRPTATQELPTHSSPARKARLTMEQSWLSPSSICHHQPLKQSFIQPTKPTSLAICFPGSSSQYIGMGSFLSHRTEFKHIWDQAISHLNSFHSWFSSLNLIDHFVNLGYSHQHALLLGSPPKPTSYLENKPATRNLMDIVLKGPQNELSRSINAQPAILITSMAYLRTLEREANIPLNKIATVYAGHSSGEYTACVASNALDFKSGIYLTRLYGLLSERSMSLAGLSAPTESSPAQLDEQYKPQMSALLINEKYQASLGQQTYDYRQLITLIERFNAQHTHPHSPLRVQIASFNSSNQIVLSGTRPGVLAACAYLNELEIANRAADLPCSSPFHSAFMRPAAEGMKLALDAVPFAVPDQPILITRNCLASSDSAEPSQRRRRRETGATGEVIETVYISTLQDLPALKAHLSGSIARPVWWAETVNELLHPHQPPSPTSIHHDHHHQLIQLLFIGPGKALNNLCKKQIAFNHSHPSPILSSNALKQPQIVTRSLATLDDFETLLAP